jgi:FkbM family methyltransferase
MIVRWHGSNKVRIGEFIVTFDRRDRLIGPKLIVDGGYEEAEVALLCSSIRPGDVAFDIGANIGIYTLPMSRAVGPTGTVVAFEPDPDNLRLLEHNVKTNECDNVRIVPCALGSHDGEAALYQSEDNRGNLSLADLSQTGKSVRVAVRRGDTVLRELGIPAPRVIKMDVEGAEPLVYAGLGCRPRHIQLEFVPGYLRVLELDPMTFLTRLVSDGYEIAVIDADTGHLSDTSAETLLEMAESANLGYNLMATLV